MATTETSTIPGEAGRFRGRQYSQCRCSVPRRLPNVLSELRSASGQCSRLAESLRSHLVEYFGAKGMPTQMLAALKEASVALDWKHFVGHIGTKDQYSAFFRMAELMRPALADTIWPDPTQFPHVSRAWPSLRGPHGWFQQAKELLRRIRAVARDHRLAARFGWWRRTGWIVLPVLANKPLPVWSEPQLLELTLGRLSLWQSCWYTAGSGFSADRRQETSEDGFLEAASKAARSNAIQLIGEFIGTPFLWHGPVQKKHSPAPFRVSLKALANLGHGKQLPKARGKKSSYVFRGDIGKKNKKIRK